MPNDGSLVFVCLGMGGHGSVVGICSFIPLNILFFPFLIGDIKWRVRARQWVGGWQWVTCFLNLPNISNSQIRQAFRGDMLSSPHHCSCLVTLSNSHLPPRTNRWQETQNPLIPFTKWCVEKWRQFPECIIHSKQSTRWVIVHALPFLEVVLGGQLDTPALVPSNPSPDRPGCSRWVGGQFSVLICPVPIGGWLGHCVSQPSPGYSVVIPNRFVGGYPLPRRNRQPVISSYPLFPSNSQTWVSDPLFQWVHSVTFNFKSLIQWWHWWPNTPIPIRHWHSIIPRVL